MLYNIREKLTWTDNLEGLKIMIHNDIDALLSGGFLLQRGAVISAMYDLRVVNIVKKEDRYNIHKLVGIDLDMNYKDMQCFGHHVVAPLNKNAFNINEFMNIDVNNNSFFKQKFPANTIIMLYSLFNIKPTNDREIALLVYADSVIQNFDKYKWNIKDWLTLLEQYEILDALTNRKDKILKIIEEEIIPVASMYKFNESNPQNLNNSERKYPQCQQYVDYRTKELSQKSSPLFSLIENIMGWDMSNFPTTFECSVWFYKPKEAIRFDKEKFELLTEHLQNVKEKIVSMAFSYSDGLQLTMLHEDDYNELYNKLCNHDEFIKIKNIETGELVYFQKKHQ